MWGIYMKITQEEIDALIEYQGAEYVEINNLLHLDLYRYKKIWM